MLAYALCALVAFAAYLPLVLTNCHCDDNTLYCTKSFDRTGFLIDLALCGNGDKASVASASTVVCQICLLAMQRDDLTIFIETQRCECIQECCAVVKSSCCTATSTPQTGTTTTGAGAVTAASEEKLGAGGIVGITVAGLVLMGAIGFALVYYLKNHGTWGFNRLNESQGPLLPSHAIQMTEFGSPALRRIVPGPRDVDPPPQEDGEALVVHALIHNDPADPIAPAGNGGPDAHQEDPDEIQVLERDGEKTPAVVRKSGRKSQAPDRYSPA